MFRCGLFRLLHDANHSPNNNNNNRNQNTPEDDSFLYEEGKRGNKQIEKGNNLMTIKRYRKTHPSKTVLQNLSFLGVFISQLNEINSFQNVEINPVYYFAL